MRRPLSAASAAITAPLRAKCNALVFDAQIEVLGHLVPVDDYQDQIFAMSEIQASKLHLPNLSTLSPIRKDELLLQLWAMARTLKAQMAAQQSQGIEQQTLITEQQLQITGQQSMIAELQLRIILKKQFKQQKSHSAMFFKRIFRLRDSSI